MASLKIADATYGRDSVGLTSLIKNLEGDIDKAIKALDSKEYTTFVNTVKANWVGDDANRFLKQFQNDVASIKKDFKSYKSTITSALNTDAKNFKSFQSKQQFVINKNV